MSVNGSLVLISKAKILFRPCNAQLRLRCELKSKIVCSVLFAELRYKLRACNMSSTTILTMPSTARALQVADKNAFCNGTLRLLKDFLHTKVWYPFDNGSLSLSRVLVAFSKTLQRVHKQTNRCLIN